MRFFSPSLVLALSLSTMSAFAEESIDAILQNSKDALNQAEETEVPDQKTYTEDFEWLKGVDLENTVEEKPEKDTAQQRAWNQISGSLGPQYATQPIHPKLPDDVMYVYVSLSMPDASLRNLFLQALREHEHRRIIFVLRGWRPPGPNRIVTKLNELFPDAQKLRQLPNVQINPVLFQDHEIQDVPTFQKKDKTGVWHRLVGETSIQDAIRRLDQGNPPDEPIGPTFDIQEPNILKLIQEKIAQVDWNSQVEAAKERALTKVTTGKHLPYATKDRSYLVDLTIVNRQNLDVRGEVFARRGTTINPFDYMTTQHHWIFIDANDPRQVHQALKWRDQYEYVTFISSVPVKTLEGRREVIEMLNQPVHEVNSMLIERFNLTEVPAIAYQDGKMLRVDVAGLNEQGELSGG